jgi:hypothetical protein
MADRIVPEPNGDGNDGPPKEPSEELLLELDICNEEPETIREELERRGIPATLDDIAEYKRSGLCAGGDEPI